MVLLILYFDAGKKFLWDDGINPETDICRILRIRNE